MRTNMCLYEIFAMKTDIERDKSEKKIKETNKNTTETEIS